ncbi:RTA1 like [Fusarium napiforme]|uniref:RTA1 like n=1 Tax=Fusarium napiforme TaxID=42672 RepID=A0A8H5KAP4_9HYPO|nr:RTA1 like [Fusarium napiforme]
MTMDTLNLGGNIFYLTCHVFLIMPQIYWGVRHKTWGYLFGMSCGHVLDMVGFAARIRMHFGQTGFVTLFDFVALILQATGGSMLGSDERDTINVGLKVIKAGLAAHLAGVSIFVFLATECWLPENETTIMLLEGMIIVIATSALAIGHPGPSFQGCYQDADFQLKKSGDVEDASKSDDNSSELL